MGSPARDINYVGNTVGNTVGPEVVPIPRPDSPTSGSGLNAALTGLADQATRAFERAAYSLSCAYEQTASTLAERYRVAERRTREIALRTKIEALTLKRERPMQVLGIIAATAFAAGIAVRLWRSRS